MKNFMKAYFLNLLCLICFGFFNQLQAQTAQTLNRTYPLEDKIEQLVLDFGDAPVEVRRTMGSRLTVEMTVKANVPNEKMLGFLIEQGRYDLQTQTNLAAGTMYLNSKKTNNVLMVKGQPCKEEFAYIVYVPNQLKFVKNSNSILLTSAK
jgi:hypothetical protein